MSSIHSHGEIHLTRRDGGVEEKKENEPDICGPLPTESPQKLSPEALNGSDDHDPQNFQEQLQRLGKVVMGGCGSAIEAVTFFVQDCRWPVGGHRSNGPNHIHDALHQQHPHYGRPAAPPLSIAQELQKLAQLPRPSVRSTDIPKFLGEEAVYPFEDDNISCISAHTLEEMALRGSIPHHLNHVNHNNGGIARQNGVNPAQALSHHHDGGSRATLSHSHSSTSKSSQGEECA